MNLIERDEVYCRSCIGQPIQDTLEVLEDGRITTIELTETKEIEKYSELFESFRNVSQITKIMLSNADWGVQPDYLERIFTRVGHLEALSCYYNKKIVKLMPFLKNLKSVTIFKVKYGKEIKDFFETQANITSLELTMESRDDGIKMLTLLSNNNNLRNNLTEFKLCLEFDADVLEKIKTFQNLQVLRIDMDGKNFGEIPSIHFNGLPKYLRHIKFDGLRISCRQFLSLLGSLKWLLVFDVGTGDIFLDTDKDIGLGDSRVTTFITTKLIEDHPQRTVNIMREKSLTRMDY